MPRHTLEVAMPGNIAGIRVKGRDVYYAAGEVIAIGQVARAFVQERGGSEPEDVRAGAQSRDDRAFRFSGLADPVAIVDEGLERGERVQLNHVLFAHSECHCDDACCGPRSFKAYPYRANPYRANPYRANVTTSAEPADHPHGFPDPTVDAYTPRGPAQVWILDTGIAAEGSPTTLDGRGIDGHLVDLPDQVPPGGEGLVDPVAGHGTFIAGIIEQLVSGCRIEVRDVIGPWGDLQENEVADAIDLFVADAGDDDLTKTILNLSFGGALYSTSSSVVGDSIADARARGVVVVASAGNSMSCLPNYPANFPGVVAVGAVDRYGEPAHFTNIGSWVQACALGVDVVSSFFRFPPPGVSVTAPACLEARTFSDGWAVWSGTSFATPVVVAAIAARIVGDGVSAEDALAQLLENGEPVDCLGVRIDPPGFADALLDA